MRTLLGIVVLAWCGCTCPGEGSGTATASARVEASAGGQAEATGGDPAPTEGGEGARVAAGSDLCEPSECGPAMGMPNHLCPDGTTNAGPSGRCLRHDDGTCGWEVIECPG